MAPLPAGPDYPLVRADALPPVLVLPEDPARPTVDLDSEVAS